MSVEEDVVHAFAARGWTLALAESVTGGLVAERLTRVPGAGDVLAGSVVAYMDHAKRDLLGVDARLLATEGAISAAVAMQMAEGARKRLRSDVAIALTGAAGPQAPQGVEVGLVFLALATPEGTTVVERRFEGPRGRVREAAAEEALRMALASVAR